MINLNISFAELCIGIIFIALIIRMVKDITPPIRMKRDDIRDFRVERKKSRK